MFQLTYRYGRDWPTTVVKYVADNDNGKISTLISVESSGEGGGQEVTNIYIPIRLESGKSFLPKMEYLM
jgi:hypothetical protein